MDQELHFISLLLLALDCLRLGITYNILPAKDMIGSSGPLTAYTSKTSPYGSWGGTFLSYYLYNIAQTILRVRKDLGSKPTSTIHYLWD